MWLESPGDSRGPSVPSLVQKRFPLVTVAEPGARFTVHSTWLCARGEEPGDDDRAVAVRAQEDHSSLE